MPKKKKPTINRPKPQKKSPVPKKLAGKKKPSPRSKSKKKTKTKKNWKWRLFKFFFKIFLLLATIGFILGFFLVIYFAHDLPNISKLYEDKLKPSITILDANGDLVTTYGDVFTEFVQVKDMPDSLIDAVLATEDRRFYKHFGIDPRGLARAMFVNFKEGRFVQGGSTVTQQLAKVVFLKPERTLKRKVQEALLAVWLERKFTKDQILTMYLNRVYLGSGVYGVDAAARKYFRKSARDINMFESAMLAGLLKAPSTYSPQNNPMAAADRTNQVLLNMVDAEKISEDEMKQALLTGTEVHKSTIRSTSRYFTDYVVDQIPEYIGNVSGNLVITTSFQPGFQKLAEDSINQNMIELSAKLNMGQVALVSMKPNGAIVALIGGVDYAESQFNRATQAQRQPGSLFKLFVYMAALEQGRTPATIINDEQIRIKGWSPRNYNGQYNGEVTLKEALTRSLNAATVNLSEEIGRKNVIALAQRMGVKSKLNDLPSIALGSSEVNLVEMTTAFAHLANQGKAVIPYVIEQIRTDEGDILYQRTGDYNFQILGVNATKMMNDMLVSVVQNGTARGAQIGRDAAGKTGTTQNYHDAWFIGFTPQITTGVWVGNDDNAPMEKVSGGSVPARIWRDYMRPALAETPPAYIDTNPYPEIQGNPWQRDNFWDKLIEED